MAFMSLAGVSCLVRQWIPGLRQSRSLCRIFLLFYAKENSDPEVVGLLFGVAANHAEWRSVHSLSSASSLFSHLEFGHYVMSPSYLAALVRCVGVLSWRNAWSDYGYIFASSEVQFLGWSSTCLLLCNDRALVRQWRKLWAPQLHSSLWSLSLVCRSCRFSGASVEETVVSHSCSLSRRLPLGAVLDKVVDMPLLCYRQVLGLWVQKNCGFSAVAVHRQGVVVPAILQ